MHLNDLEKVHTFSIARATDIPAVAEQVQIFAIRCGLGKTQQHKLIITLYELAQNQIKHAHGGSIVLSVIIEDSKKFVELLAEDTGPGIADVEDAMRDGFSTLGTLGLGLGGVKRMMDSMTITSSHETGTKIVARIGVN